VTKGSRKIYEIDVTYIHILGWVVRLYVLQELEERECDNFRQSMLTKEDWISNEYSFDH